MQISIPRTRKLNFEGTLLLLALLIGFPGIVVVCVLLWTGDYSTNLRWTIAGFLVSFTLLLSFRLREQVIVPLQTLSNILAGLREEDYSIRARGAGFNGALAELMYEVNTLGETLRQQRMGSVDAITLLRMVMAEIDVAVFTFDANLLLRLVNRAGERLLAAPAERVAGKSA
jgi:two-component system, NtrC family, nitrogen regulation sensor histidine kinase NtrY